MLDVQQIVTPSLLYRLLLARSLQCNTSRHALQDHGRLRLYLSSNFLHCSLKTLSFQFRTNTQPYKEHAYISFRLSSFLAFKISFITRFSRRIGFVKLVSGGVKQYCSVEIPQMMQFKSDKKNLCDNFNQTKLFRIDLGSKGINRPGVLFS